ncbi:hypothetical protein Plhal703r1_c43g0143521 [Plasmopara halstedii]
MWIPAVRLTAERNTDELFFLLLGCVRDFVRISHRGIGFVCTSEEALRCLLGVTLKLYDKLVTKGKYSHFDKLYFVNLQRPPFNVPDRDI